MKYCPLCNERYPDDSVFCGNDGTRLEGDDAAPLEAPVPQCGSCGERLEADAHFCPECGEPYHDQNSAIPFRGAERANPESSHKPIDFTSVASEPGASYSRPSNEEERDRSTRRYTERRSFKEGIKPIYVIWGAVAVALILVAALALQFLPSWVSKTPQVAQKSDVADPSVSPSSAQPNTQTSTPEAAAPTKMAEVATPNPASSPPPSSGVTTQEVSRPSETKGPVTVAKRTDQPAKSEPEFIKKEFSPPQRSDNKPEISPPSRETPIPRRPAEPGTYETIKATAARTTPSDSAEIVDQINAATRLNVSGSEGDWLVVQSKTRNRTVYVKRDDAMFLPERVTRGASTRDSELKWKEVENQIQQAIARRGITGVTVSFVGDTAYLRGKVETEDQRHAAEQAARTMPEVIHIHNGIWLNR